MNKMMKNINRKQPLIIIGASGFGKEVAWLAEDCGVPVKGFLDDNPNVIGKKKYNYPVLGAINSAHSYEDSQFVIGVGDPRIRKKILNVLEKLGVNNFATLIHPTVNKSSSVYVGEGSVICCGNILTVDISIGRHCQLNLLNTIGHDTVINDFCTVAPQSIISGNVTIKSGVEIGTGVSIRQGIQVGCGSMIGMGALLVKDSEENTIYIGSPAKAFKQLESFIC